MLAAWCQQQNLHAFSLRMLKLPRKPQAATALFSSCSSAVVAWFGQRGIMRRHKLIGCEETWTRARAVTSAGMRAMLEGMTINATLGVTAGISTHRCVCVFVCVWPSLSWSCCVSPHTSWILISLRKDFQQESDCTSFLKPRPFSNCGCFAPDPGRSHRLHLITGIKGSLFIQRSVLLSASVPAAKWSASPPPPSPSLPADGCLSFCIKTTITFASTEMFLQAFAADFVFITVVTAG